MEGWEGRREREREGGGEKGRGRERERERERGGGGVLFIFDVIFISSLENRPMNHTAIATLLFS